MGERGSGGGPSQGGPSHGGPSHGGPGGHDTNSNWANSVLAHAMAHASGPVARTHPCPAAGHRGHSKFPRATKACPLPRFSCFEGYVPRVTRVLQDEGLACTETEAPCASVEDRASRGLPA